MKYFLLALFISSSALAVGPSIIDSRGPSVGTKVTSSITTSCNSTGGCTMENGGVSLNSGTWLIGYSLVLAADQINGWCKIDVRPIGGGNNKEIIGSISSTRGTGSANEHHGSIGKTTVVNVNTTTTYYIHLHEQGDCTIFPTGTDLSGSIVAPDMEAVLWAVKIR